MSTTEAFFEESREQSVVKATIKALVNCDTVPELRRVMTRVYFFTGVRPGELHGWRVSDLRQEHGVWLLDVREQWTLAHQGFPSRLTARRAKISSDARDRLLGHRPRDTKALHYEDEDEVLPLLAEEIAKIPSLLDDVVVSEATAAATSDDGGVDQGRDEQSASTSYVIKSHPTPTMEPALRRIL